MKGPLALPNFCDLLWQDFKWGPWIPLDADIRNYKEAVTALPGLYRVRICDSAKLAYIGQTGRNLRERTRSLAKHTYSSESSPPWNDPHTAAPCLWAYRREEGLSYEVSVTPAELDQPTRQCVEDMLLYAYRLETGESTLANHGRFHPHWKRPSNKKNGRCMERLSVTANSAAYDSLPPAAFVGEPFQSDWLGLDWSKMLSLDLATDQSPRVAGVYRLFNASELVYLGESEDLRSRLMSHRMRFNDSVTGASWCVLKDALSHHLKERETDLIGAYFMCCRRPPRYQYGGNKKNNF